MCFELVLNRSHAAVLRKSLHDDGPLALQSYLEEMWCESAKLIEDDRKYEDSRLQERWWVSAFTKVENCPLHRRVMLDTGCCFSNSLARVGITVTPPVYTGRLYLFIYSIISDRFRLVSSLLARNMGDYCWHYIHVSHRR